MCKFPNEKCVASSYKEKDKLEYNDPFYFYTNGAIIQYYVQRSGSALNTPN